MFNAPFGTPIVLSINGWQPANEVWTYATQYTFTVAGDVTDKYGVGDKIKLTQGGVVKQFYIIGSVYGAPNTTITVTAGVAFTLANSPITDNYFSHGNPVGFPAAFTWTPTYSCSGSMTYTAITTQYARFYISGRRLFYDLRATGTTGGTASTTIFATPPVASVAGTNLVMTATFSDTTPGVARGYYSAASGLAIVKQVSGVDGNWALTAGALLMASGNFEI